LARLEIELLVMSLLDEPGGTLERFDQQAQGFHHSRVHPRGLEKKYLLARIPTFQANSTIVCDWVEYQNF
jgi:hypothetical protein